MYLLAYNVVQWSNIVIGNAISKLILFNVFSLVLIYYLKFNTNNVYLLLIPAQISRGYTQVYSSYCVIIRVRVVLKRTVVGD